MVVDAVVGINSAVADAVIIVVVDAVVGACSDSCCYCRC